MLKLEIVDVDVGEDYTEILCRDEAGCYYKFSTDPSKGKLLSLLVNDVYLPSNTIYELFINMVGAFNAYIHSIIIIDGYKDQAVVNIATGNEIQSIPISISDALILALLSNTDIYIKKQACLLEFENLEQYVWYRLLKELDLC